MATKKEYRVVSNTNEALLSGDVSSLRDKGWKLRGDIVVSPIDSKNTRFTQVLVKETKAGDREAKAAPAPCPGCGMLKGHRNRCPSANKKS